MAIKVVDIADEIHRELGSPSDLSISAISYWLRTNIGQLNNLLYLYFKFGIKKSIILSSILS